MCTLLPYNDQYDIMDVMPRWAYHKDEWSDLVLKSNKIVDGIMYTKTEPEPVDKNAELVANILSMM